jgi:hypothetical protein
MSRASLVIAALIACVKPTHCPAQESPPAPAEPVATRPADKHNVRNFRQEDPNSLLDRLTKELNLDAAQQEAVSQALKDHQTYVTQIRQTMQNQPTEGYQKMRALTDEMHAAREAGDLEKVKQLSEQVRELGREQQEKMAPMREQLAQSNEKLRDSILAALREDQKAGFDKFWEEKMARRGSYRGPERSPQALKALVEQMSGLTIEQRQQIEQLFRQHMEAEKTAPKGSSAERALVTKLYDAVMASLTPEQRTMLEMKLAGRPRGARGEGVSTPPKSPNAPGQPESPANPQSTP